MTAPMKEVLDALTLLAPIEWARCVGGSQPPRPPLLAWRFVSLDSCLESRVREALECYKGAVTWVLQRGHRNLVLTISEFAAFAQSYRVDTEALQAFGHTHSLLTATAMDDASRLARHLRRNFGSL